MNQFSFENAQDGLNSKNEFTRGLITYSLKYIPPSKEIMDKLVSLLEDESSFVRGNACAALGNIGLNSKWEVDSVLVARLVSVMENDVDGEVRGNAAQAVGCVGMKNDYYRLLNCMGLPCNDDFVRFYKWGINAMKTRNIIVEGVF